MREAGRIVAEVFGEVAKVIRPGVSTYEIDRVVETAIKRRGGKPLFKGYPGPEAVRSFPASSCISINEEVVHGIPKKDRVLREGDIVSVDVGVGWRGYCGDGAVTFCVGSVSDRARKLVATCYRALLAGIAQAKAGNRLSQIGAAVQHCAESAGFGVVRRFVGHGIGTSLHEAPKVPNYVDEEVLKEDLILECGMVLAIEPMLTEGTYELVDMPDQWTQVTADRRLSAHFEHTVAITREGAEILTPWEKEIDTVQSPCIIGLFGRSENYAERGTDSG